MTAADIRYYFVILLRWLPRLLLTVAVFTGGGILISLVMPTSFKATAMIVVEDPQLPTQLARSTVPQNAVAQIQLVEQQLMSDTALVQMAAAFGLYQDEGNIDVAGAIRANTSLEQLHFGRDEQIINALTISFSAADAALAARVANRFATTIVSEDAARRRSRAGDTLAFFRQDVAALEAELSASENTLLEFKNDNVDALPESLLFRRNQQARNQEKLLQLEQEEATSRGRRNNLVVMLQTNVAIDGVFASPQEKLLADLQTALSSQLTIFAPDSANVAGLRARIASLEQSTGSEPDVAPTARTLPLTMEISEIDARLAAIRLEKLAIEASSSALVASVRATPENETRLNALERQRDNIQTQYNAAVVRLSEASTGEQVETLLKGERLVLMEAATPPRYTTGPQRRVIVALSTLAGIAVAMLGMIGFELLDRRVRRPVDLQRVLGIDVMAVIPELTASRKLAAPVVSVTLIAMTLVHTAGSVPWNA